MKTRLFHLKVIFTLSIIAVVLLANAQSYHQIPSFGTQTLGGIDGKVIKVTNLNASGSGSLKAAIDATGIRLIVFEVGGVIDMNLGSISIKNPNITIAGQTAPYPGITIIRGMFNVSTHDVVIQHIAIRPGDAGQPAAQGWEPDGVTTVGNVAYNIVFDHCSATWAIDENLSVSGPADSNPFTSSHDVTLYRCIVAEGLSNSTHTKGEHSKGSLLHDGVSNVAIIECLYAHNMQRNPLLKGNASAFIANNVIYNSGNQCIGVSDIGSVSGVTIGKSLATVVGNTWIKGNNSTSSAFITGSSGRNNGDVFASGNILKNVAGVDQKLMNSYVTQLDSPLIWPQDFIPKPASDVAYEVLRTAGSRPAQRDSIDMRIVHSVLSCSGKIVDSQNEVGGYPVYAKTSKTQIVPDGKELRMAWLDSMSNSLDNVSYTLETGLLSNIIGVKDENTSIISGLKDVKVVYDQVQKNIYILANGLRPESTTIKLIDAHGATILQKKEYRMSEISKVSINVEGIKNGLYFIILENGSEVTTKKVLLK